jgi:DNA-binding MurR/RpiR family transcriptional regulator
MSAHKQPPASRPTREAWWEIKDDLAEALDQARQAYYQALDKTLEDLEAEDVREATAFLRKAAEALRRERVRRPAREGLDF